MTIVISALSEERFDDFVNLINDLADYEKLDRPSAEAVTRLRADAFGDNPRFEAFLADIDGKAVGYAITFQTYSSFLAKPTQYLEDLYVREDARNAGVGGALFDHVHNLAKSRGCGRMEWQVLDWNKLARDFYERRGARFLHDWCTYRIDLS